MGIFNARQPKVRFEIRPRTRRDGYTLISHHLPYPLWYTNAPSAERYARFLSRDEGCRIEIFNAEGDLLEQKMLAPEG